MAMEERTPVQIGVDLRPVPLQMPEPDNSLWLFNPDPGKEFFAKAMSLSKKMQKQDDKAWDALDELMDSLSTQLMSKKQRTEFLEKGYGIAVLQGLVKAYVESVVALPTEQSSPSGKAQGARGGNKSRVG